jgi:hypothetical protein
MPLGANQLYDDSTRFTATAASHARAGANAHRVSAAALPRRSATQLLGGRPGGDRSRDRAPHQGSKRIANGSADLIRVACIPGVAHRWRTPVLSIPSLSLDTPIEWRCGVGRNAEMPCRGGRMRFL